LTNARLEISESFVLPDAASVATDVMYKNDKFGLEIRETMIDRMASDWH
jgi:hypothetical protein